MSYGRAAIFPEGPIPGSRRRRRPREEITMNIRLKEQGISWNKHGSPKRLEDQERRQSTAKPEGVKSKDTLNRMSGDYEAQARATRQKDV